MVLESMIILNLNESEDELRFYLIEKYPGELLSW